MTLLFALTIGVLFGTGVLLLLKSDLFRIIAGLALISNAANLTLMGSGLTRSGQAPIQPHKDGEPVADALVQAMTLTALVIGFAVTSVLLALVFGVYRDRHTVDLDELSREDAQAAMDREAGDEALDQELRADSRSGDHEEVVR